MSFDVGERIREFRKQAGLNQDQLADSEGHAFESHRAYQEKP